MLEYTIIFFLMLVSLILSLYYAKKNNLLMYVLLTTIFLPLVLMFTSKFIDFNYKYFLFIREIPVYLFGLIFLIRIYKMKKINLILIILIIYLFVLSLYFIYPNNISYFTKIMSARELSLFFLYIFVGYFINIEEWTIKNIKLIIIVISLLGFIEYNVGAHSYWHFFNIEHIVDTRNNNNQNIYDVELGGFANSTNVYSKFYEYGGGKKEKRIGGLYANVNDFSQLFAFFTIIIFVYILFYRKFNLNYLIYGITAFIIQFFSRGDIAFLTVILSLLIFYVFYKSSYLKYKIELIYIFSVIVIPILFFSLFIDRPDYMNHMMNLINGFKVMIENPSGLGLGRAGSLLIQSKVVGDSLVAMIMVQGGIILFFLYTLFYIFTFFYLIYIYKKHANYLILMNASMLIAIYILSFLSEAVNHRQSVFLVYMLLGTILKTYGKNRQGDISLNL